MARKRGRAAGVVEGSAVTQVVTIMGVVAERVGGWAIPEFDISSYRPRRLVFIWRAFSCFLFFYGFLVSESLSTARFGSVVSIRTPFRLIITSLFPYV
jgi:hypothetical protein